MKDLELRIAQQPRRPDLHLLELTIDVANYQVCGVHQSTVHLMRMMSMLWRIMVIGTGEADLVWANPGTSLPLRVHSFATLLHLVGSTTMFLSRNGVTQLDGVSIWDVATLSKVLAAAFDERKLFGSAAVEVIDEEQWLQQEFLNTASSSGSPSEKRKRRHVRQTYEVYNDLLSRDTASSGTDSRDLPAVDEDDEGPADIPLEPLDIDLGAICGKGPDKESLSPSSLDSLPKREYKVDSKADFQSAFRSASAADDSDGFESDNHNKTILQAFGGMSGGRGRFMTAPSRALSTIREINDEELDLLSNGSEITSETPRSKEDETLDDALILKTGKSSVKQFRKPDLKKAHRANTLPPKQKEIPRPQIVKKQSSVPKTEEIEEAGAKFLESLSGNFGVRNLNPTGGEERRVGSSYHRKTRSRSSIDWSVMMEPRTPEPSGLEESASKDEVCHQDESMSTLSKEESTVIRLPSFVDRLELIGKSNESCPRWFPYMYEVIIMQWHALLLTQRRSAEQSSASFATGERVLIENESLSQAAVRAIGVAVACAPLLFEVIKQSIGYRVATLFHAATAKNSMRTCPPLIALDETLSNKLEHLISMVTDACLDSRNFDSWELRIMSIDVNDSIVRFLRDMFSFLAPASVHRMILVYLSRFVTKEGKQWQDRDSSIGLRCSWEITKLRLNAVTALVRFPDFIRVNSPQMMSWDGSNNSFNSDSFLDKALIKFEQYRLPDLVGGEETSSYIPKIDIPSSMKPHWLAELVVDICLLGTVHAEQYIQNRSGSLIHELFWFCSQNSVLRGTNAAVGGMFITMLEKILPNVTYLSNFAPKSQLRKDIIPCAVYVLQVTPANLLRALWRRLFRQLPEKGRDAKYGGVKDVRILGREGGREQLYNSIAEHGDEVGILDMFSFMNLALKTMEYEGAEEHLEYDSASHSRDSVDMWRREYILTLGADVDVSLHKRDTRDKQETGSDSIDNSLYTSSVSRKWQSHDASLVLICTTHQIVLEMYQMLNSSADGRALLNPSVRSNRTSARFKDELSGQSPSRSHEREAGLCQKLSMADIVVFVRGAASVYLHALALRESDLVIVRTFRVAAEALKIFGIKLFLEALGETLQHWMRTISLHCGARRAQVRVEATDLLELILRSTWECYGSFFRIRVPLLAVQTEVMERVVATAAARYYRDQRRERSAFENFSNVNAEASLVPLWRTLDRIEKQPASQNIAFRGALIRMAEKLKKLYRAYVAARVLSFIQGARASTKEKEDPFVSHETEARLRARRISVLRVINASEGYSKQFLGFQGTAQHKTHLAHYEAVEDALIDAADVFSPTELPEHRVAWLRMLADFHASRKKYAEEATCHFYIHTTLQQAAQLHGSLWSNTPFLPWTDNIPDPVYIDGENPTVDPEFSSDADFDGGEGQFGRQMESASSFRRIFYRVANSVGMSNNEWEIGESKNLFFGVTSASEYQTVRPWITLREMEENMVEEAEAAAELYLKAGIVQSSRFAWNLATLYYQEKYNYGKLAVMYGNLARTVVTEVPPIDTSLPMEVSATLGRFYRVWFHGGAPDSLSGVEFVYRTAAACRLDQFGEELKDVIKSIIPDKTPIHLLLDGRAEERLDDGALNFGFSRIGPAPLEPVRIKVSG